MHMSRLHCKVLKLIVYHHHHHHHSTQVSAQFRTKVKNSKNIQGFNSEIIDIIGPNSSFGPDFSQVLVFGSLVPSSLNDVQRQEVQLNPVKANRELQQLLRKSEGEGEAGEEKMILRARKSRPQQLCVSR